MHLANQLLGCTISIEEISEDTNLLINAINNGKHRIVHLQLLTPKQLIRAEKTRGGTKFQISCPIDRIQLPAYS